MPRGQYDREAARIRREGSDANNANVVSAGASVSRKSGRIERGEDWGNRTRKVKGAIDYYELASGLAPDDAVYEWKRYTIYGQEQKIQQIVYHENGWSAVPAERHPHLPSIGNNIIHEGLILMEQPKELHEEAVRENDRARLEQLAHGRESLSKTPQGQLDRVNPSVKASKERMSIDAPEYERE